MRQLDEAQRRFFTEHNWILATMGDEPHAAPYAFKLVLPDGRLALAAIFMGTGADNVRRNGKASVAVVAPSGEAYRATGPAVYLEDGEELKLVRTMVADKSAAMAAANPGAPQRERVVKGAVIVSPERLTVISPGPNNKKELW